jgi:NADH-quinone oxidoreductase subunit N
MMAYSSIAQAGFMLFGIFANNATAMKGIMLYSVAYTLASFGVFAVLIKLKDYTYDGFNGLAKRHPVLAITATICLLSLAGIPLTGGFFAKYFMLSATVEQGKWIGLVVFAVLMAAVSAYYYFKVIMSMYFKNGEAAIHSKPSNAELAVLIINAAMVVLLGVLPQLVFLP